MVENSRKERSNPLASQKKLLDRALYIYMDNFPQSDNSSLNNFKYFQLGVYIDVLLLRFKYQI